MKEKLFLIKKSSNYPLERLKKKSVPELTVTADYVLESFGSFSTLVTEGIINLSEYHLIPKQVQEEEHHVQVGKNDDWIDIVINNELQPISSTPRRFYLYIQEKDGASYRCILLLRCLEKTFENE